MPTPALVLGLDAAEEPITVEEAKIFLGEDGVERDALIRGLIKAARQKLEDELDKAFVTQTRKLVLDDFPDNDGIIYLPRPPLQSVTSITYKDTDGNTQVLDSADYQVDAQSKPGRVYPAPAKTWPSVETDRLAAVEILYVCGYGGALVVPSTIREAIKLIVQHVLDPACCQSGEVEIPPQARWLIEGEFSGVYSY